MSYFNLKELHNVTSQLNVLYVEDEPFLREGMVKSLNQLFKSVTVAEDGLIGLELYKKCRYDLVITDISMPNMDGINMISHIKDIDPTARFIVTSAQNDGDKLLTLINLGVDRFLTKPLQKPLLIDALYVVCSAIVNAINTKKYQIELEQKVRILNTQLKKESIRFNNDAPSPVKRERESESYFQQILREDVDELRDLNDEIDYNLLLAFQGNAPDFNYIEAIAKIYLRYGSILNRYHAFAELATALYTLSNTHLRNTQGIVEKSSMLYELLESLNFTLITFRKNTLETPAQNPMFYNASLLSDIEMIGNRINNTESDSEVEFF